MKLSRKEKKNKDRFSITIVGVLVYSILLISVMAGTYVGVKSLFKHQQTESAITTIEEEKTVEEDITETEEVPSYGDEEQGDGEDEETVYNDHTATLSDIMDQDTGLVDYEKILFKPEKRDASLTWKDTIFSKVENVNSPKDAAVNTFNLKRVFAELKNHDQAEYSVFTNPDTENVDKITEIVDCGGNYQIFDYYYDHGNINYIAQYDMSIIKPVSLTSADIESRFYFNKDVMVRYIYCGDGKAIEYTVQDIDAYSQGTVEQFDYLEKDMLNRAYIVLNLAKSLDEVEIIDGYIMDEFLVPLDDVEVTIYSDSDEKEIANGRTDGDGYYRLSVKTSDDTFTLKANADREVFDGVNAYGITAASGSVRYSVDPIYLSYKTNGAFYNVQILVRDAYDSSKGLSGGKIKLRRGISNTEGEVIAVGDLDDTGAILVPMTAGCYTAEVSKGGYETVYFPVNVRVDHQSAIGFAVPDVPQGSYKAVLTWETSPLDLDFKAISSCGMNIYKPSADSLGAIMAEVITIDEVGSDDYKFYVNDYGSISTGDALSYNMTGSKAMVTVYGSEGYIASYHVPVASAGIVWEPFEIFNNKLLPINNYFYSIEDELLWKSK